MKTKTAEDIKNEITLIRLAYREDRSLNRRRRKRPAPFWIYMAAVLISASVAAIGFTLNHFLS